jgi:hypothetical protein
MISEMLGYLYLLKWDIEKKWSVMPQFDCTEFETQ